MSLSEEFLLYEFTSSGLTHTFTSTSPLKSEGVAGVVRQKSKGFLFEWAYSMFVSVCSSQSREYRFKDHYAGLHYGVLEIDLFSKQKTVVMNIVDYLGEVVISRKIPLLERGQFRGGRALLGVEEVDCHPFHGAAPVWRVALSRHALWFIPLLFLGAPALLLLRLLLGVLYSFCGSRKNDKKKEK
jgi:hypothetical protein